MNLKKIKPGNVLILLKVVFEWQEIHKNILDCSAGSFNIISIEYNVVRPHLCCLATSKAILIRSNNIPRAPDKMGF